MAIKKYLSLEGLSEYDALVKEEISKVKNDLLNGAGSAYDTLKELGDLIDVNVDAIDALETVAANKANKDHTHTIANVSGLQSALDGKAASSHGTHVSYSSTAPVMDGTASVGNASTVARSDHKHPTDTTRVSKTEFDTHTADTTKHITSAERTNWNAAKTHADTAHAPSNAEKNQNAFSNIAVSGQTTVSADATTDTLTLAGSNVTITTDATNDKVTFSVANGTTSAKGVVQLTNSISSTSTTTAATPNSVKSAYDLANTAQTAATNAQTSADNAKVIANGSIKSLSVSGKVITYTKNDGTTGTITTQDTNTTYGAAGSSLGLVKSGGDVTISDGVIAVNDDSHNHIISNVDGLQGKLDTKSEYIGTKVGSQEEVFYCKLCTITIPNTYSDIYIEFDLIGRTTGRFQNVKFVGTKSNSASLGSSALKVSGNNGNCYEVKGYQYVSTSGDTVELWCKVPSWDTLNVLKKQLAGNGEVQDWIVWNLSKYTALPTTSDSLKLISASNEAWTGNAATATTATKLGTSTVGSSSQPIYLNSGIATKVAAVGTAYGGTGATSVSGARTNLDVYSKSEVDTKLEGKANSSHGNHVPATQTASNKVFLRNDNTWQTITPANIGAAASSHTHTIDTALSSTSTNPVQNKVVNSAIISLTSTVSTNTSSINSHTSAISNLQTAVAEIQDITSEEIQALFA